MDTPKELFDRFLPVAYKIARGFYRKLPASVLLADVEAAAAVGLWQAVTAEAPLGHTNLEWYLRVRVRGAIKDELRRQDWLPRRARARAKARGETIGVLLYADLEELHLACASQTEAWMHEKEQSAALVYALGKLAARDRRIGELLLTGTSQVEIAEELKISAPRVSQLVTRVVEQLTRLVRGHTHLPPGELVAQSTPTSPRPVVAKVRRRHRPSASGRKYMKWDIPTAKALRAQGLSRAKAQATYAKSLYAARKALGLCGSCNRPPLPGKEKCEVHTTPKSRYMRYVAEGKCTSCGNAPEPGKSGCTRCLKNRAKRRARLVARLRKLGLCVTCGVEPSEAATGRCTGCKAKRKVQPKEDEPCPE